MSERNTTKTVGAALGVALANLEKTIAAVPPEVREQRIKEAAERERQDQVQRMNELLQESGAPIRQLKNAAIDRAGEWGATEAKIKSKLDTGFFIALIGNRGCGKTQIGVEAVREQAQRGKRSRFCTTTEFFMEIKAAYDSEDHSEKDVLDEFTRPALLVLDEIGQRSESEWENRLLFELLNRRYNAMKDTLIISNQSAEDFRESIGPSLLSRMTETGGIIRCQWPSYRKA